MTSTGSSTRTPNNRAVMSSFCPVATGVREGTSNPLRVLTPHLRISVVTYSQ